MAIDCTVIVVSPAGMPAVGWWGMRRARSKREFLVAGRRLGPAMYSGTMAAIVLGGAVLVMGLAVIGTAIALNNVVEALTVAYDLLVGGLLVPILGGLLWKRGTAQGALASVIVGGLAGIGLMAGYGILADEPVHYGLPSFLVAYVAVSLGTKPTDEVVLASWRERLAGRSSESASEPVLAPQ